MAGILSRKIEEWASAVYRHLVFPFVRISLEIKNDSIMKQGSYVNKHTVLEGKNYLGRDTYLSHTHMGFGSYVSEGGRLIDTKVGRYCSIGPRVYTALGLHPSKGFLSTHPATYSTSAAEGFTYADKMYFTEEKYADKAGGYRVVIGNDVWLGASVTLLDGVTIGDGAIVAAGSLVNKDIEPYAIYGGVPAKKLGDRFDAEQLSRLKAEGLTNWYELSENKIRQLIAEGKFVVSE